MISDHIVLGGNNWTLDIELEAELVTSDTYTADPNWKHTDAEGHEHQYETAYSTLLRIIDKQHWCEGNEGLSPHDPHWQVDEHHYVCKQCAEVIEPRLLHPGTAVMIPLRVKGVLEGRRSGMRTCLVRVYLNELECRQVALAENQDVAAQTLLDNIPLSRFHSIEMGGH
jgi:hypothetical protein